VRAAEGNADSVAREIAIRLAHESSPQKDHPTLWVVNRKTGEIRETSYQEEEHRNELYGEQINASTTEFYLPPNPSVRHVMNLYPEEVRHAYQDAMRQLVQISRARRSPVEKIHERHIRMGISMKDYLRYLWSLPHDNNEEKWYGELRLNQFQGRSTRNTPEETANFIRELSQFYDEMRAAGVDLCDISAEGCEKNLTQLYAYLETQQLPRYAKIIEENEWSERIKRDLIARYGVLPEHIPFFDVEFYDMDVDSITTHPQIKLSAHAKHIPLTIPQCQSLDTRQSQIYTEDIVNGIVPTDAISGDIRPTQWEIGPEMDADFSQMGYGQLFYPIKQAHKANKKEYLSNISKRERQMWKLSHPVVVPLPVDSISTYQEELQDMGKHNHQSTDPQFQRELDRMLGTETGDDPKPSKHGKKKKKSNTDIFGNRIDFSGKKKKDREKSKKKKDKDHDKEDCGTIDIDDSMDTDDAAKAISKSIQSDKLRKILAKSISQGRKVDKKK